LILGAGNTYLVVQRVISGGFILQVAISASLSGIIITGIADGREELKLLFGRLPAGSGLDRPPLAAAAPLQQR
jgi:hypothetical protein